MPGALIKRFRGSADLGMTLEGPSHEVVIYQPKGKASEEAKLANTITVDS